MKKWLCLALFLALCLTASAALADGLGDESWMFEQITSGEWVYAVKGDGTAALTGYLGNDASVTVPAEIDGIPVTELYHTFAWGSLSWDGDDERVGPFYEIHDALVQQGGGGIGVSMIENKYTVEEVVIPDGVTVIDTAFAVCTSLRRVELPDSLEVIAGRCFQSCTALEQIAFGSKLTTIESAAFSGCTKLKEASFGDGIRKIGGYAFGGTALQSVTLPDSAVSIGYRAFDESVTVIGGNYEIPEIKSSDNWSFRLYAKGGYAAVTSYNGTERDVTIPSEIDGLPVTAVENFSVGDYWDGSGFQPSVITRLTIPEGVTRIDNTSWGLDTLEEVVLPSTLETIGDRAFYEFVSLRSIVIPDSVTSIGESAFDSCSSLTDVKLPASLETIGDRAFYGCTALTSIEIPDSVTSIGNTAFSWCTALSDVKLPASLKTIGIQAFYACEALPYIDLPEGLEQIKTEAFVGTAIRVVVLPEGVIAAKKAFDERMSVYMSEEGASGITEDGLIYLIDLNRGTSTILCYTGSAPNVVVPDETNGVPVTDIGASAFIDNSAIRSVTLPSTVRSIGFLAFASCESLAEARFGSGLEEIAAYAFNGCEALTEVILPDATTYWDVSFSETTTVVGGRRIAQVLGDDETYYNLYTTDGYAEFVYYMGTGADVAIPSEAYGLPLTVVGSDVLANKSVERVIIPEGVTTISRRAFRDCTSLTEVALPSTLTTIDSEAFAGCAALTEIVLPAGVTVAEDAFDPGTKVIQQ